jgi:hypothetical protein
LDQRPAARVQVVVLSGDTLELREARVRNDSLIGQLRTPVGNGAVQTDTVRIALADVTSVRARRLSLIRSGLVVAGLATAGFVAFAVWFTLNYPG